MDDHAGVDAVDSAAEVRKSRAKRCEEREGLDETMCEPERDSDGDDRRPASIADQKGVAKTAEGELFDDRGDDADHDAVGDIGRRMIRFPRRRSDSLFLSWVEERVEQRAEHEHPDPDPDPDLRRGAPGGRTP